MPEAPVEFVLDGAPAIRGESAGAGPTIVLCHGITATRRYVHHGSRALERAGYATTAYDARGHGESDPAPDGEGYGYPELVADLERVVAARVGEGRFLLAGHSMGAHTAVAYALRHPERLAGLAVIGPVYAGEVGAETLAYWDGLADALAGGGVDGFVAYIGRHQRIDPAWRDAVLRFTRERMLLHRHPEALVEADPGHPYAVAAAYAERLPRATLISEAEGDSPLAWQGGKLSRELAAFYAKSLSSSV